MILQASMLARQSLRLMPQVANTAAARGYAAMAFTFASQGEVRNVCLTWSFVSYKVGTELLVL